MLRYIIVRDHQAQQDLYRYGVVTVSIDVISLHSWIKTSVRTLSLIWEITNKPILLSVIFVSGMSGVPFLDIL
jgi:hypothetical protein